MADYPGVDPDGNDPGGIEVAGNVEANTFTKNGEPLQASIPGVTSDGQTPPGIIVEGGIVGGSNALGDTIPSFFYNLGQTLIQDSIGGIAEGDALCIILQSAPITSGGNGAPALLISRQGSIAVKDYLQPALDIHDSTASSQDLLTLRKQSGTGRALDVNGGARFSGVIGENEKAPAAAPTAITGTITAATLAQLTAIVLELLQALDAKGSIVNSTT